MTTTAKPTGRLGSVAKWSLIIGPVLVVVFNFLLPTNGFGPVNPEDSKTFIAKLGADADLAQVYFVVILAGIILYTRAIVGLWQAVPEGVARQRLGIGALGAVAALGLWAVLIGLGLAEASVADKVVAATAGAQAGVAGAAESAASAGLVVSTLHAGFFGVYQAATYVAYISLIPLGGGIAVSGIVRREFGWAVVAVGVVTLVVTSVLPVKTEEGILAFGTLGVIWEVTFLAMGLRIARQDQKLNKTTVPAE